MREMLKAHNGDIEKLMVQLGVQRYDSALRGKKASHAPHVQQLLSHSMERLQEGVIRWCLDARAKPGRRHHAYKFIQEIPPDVCALVSAKFAIDALIKGDSLVAETTMARRLGRVLEEERRLAVFKKEAYLLWKSLLREQRHASTEHKRRVFLAAARRATTSFENWTIKDRYSVGLVMLDLLFGYTNLIERKTIYKTARKGDLREYVMITPSEDVLKWLSEAADQHALMTPVYLPTLKPPKDWSNNWDGGYFGYPLSDRGLVHSRQGINHLLTDLTSVACPIFFEGINAIQRTAWEINPDVHRELVSLHKTGSTLAGLPSSEPYDLPPRPWKKGEDPDPDVLKAWKKAARPVYERNGKRVGHCMMVSKILGTASIFEEGEPFHFPMKTDFRFRAYPVPSFLEPQGHDMAKGLLQFHRAEHVSLKSAAAQWLAIQGANMAGEDKLSVKDRVKWTHDNTDQIIRCTQGDLWWAGADKPFQFLAFCYEWARLQKHGHTITRIPISMDGSNNGLQIFSLLLRDPIGGAATNCTPSDLPCSVYQDVADLATTRLRKLKAPWTGPWLDFFGAKGMPKEATKRMVMTLPYGARRTTARDYFRDWYQAQVQEPPGSPRNRTAYQMADLIWDCISDVVPLAIQAMQWLRGVAKLVAKTGSPIIWTTPIVQLPCAQIYYKPKNLRVQTVLGTGVRRNARIPQDDPTKIHLSKMMDAIVPNLIHSLDATAMYLTTHHALRQGVHSFSMVHDDFRTHATHADALAHCLREAYINIFSGNFLLDFKKGLERRHGISLPDPPEQGDLDVQALRHSTYFFL